MCVCTEFTYPVSGANDSTNTSRIPQIQVCARARAWNSLKPFFFLRDRPYTRSYSIIFVDIYYYDDGRNIHDGQGDRRKYIYIHTVCVLYVFMYTTVARRKKRNTNNYYRINNTRVYSVARRKTIRILKKHDRCTHTHI